VAPPIEWVSVYTSPVPIIPHLTIHRASPVQKYTFTGYTQGHTHSYYIVTSSVKCSPKCIISHSRPLGRGTPPPQTPAPSAPTAPRFRAFGAGSTPSASNSRRLRRLDVVPPTTFSLIRPLRKTYV